MIIFKHVTRVYNDKIVALNDVSFGLKPESLSPLWDQVVPVNQQ